MLTYESSPEEIPIALAAADYPEELFSKCALGGTFDSIHNGHKVLLGAGVALTTQGLTIGVTDQTMNQSELVSIYHTEQLTVLSSPSTRIKLHTDRLRL